MSKKDLRGSSLRPPSAPPESAAQIDASWDDETVPGLDLDDPLNEFDRVTAIPEMPSDLYVQRVMESAQDSRAPMPGSPTVPVRAAGPEYFSFETAPPPAQRSPDSSAPHTAVSTQNAPTTRPAPSTQPARSPGVPPFSPSPTGLELADLSFDSVTSIQVAPPVEPSASVHDPRDPVIELSFEELTPPAHVIEHDSSPIGEMKDRYAMGDFSGALLIAEGILESHPEDLEAPRYAQSCRDVLTQMYSARLGSLDQVVTIALPSDQIRWLTLDHRAGFLLSLVDGGSTVDQILDISGMTRLDALRIMFQLLDQRVISLG
jgi:hypothetical protein